MSKNRNFCLRCPNAYACRDGCEGFIMDYKPFNEPKKENPFVTFVLRVVGIAASCAGFLYLLDYLHNNVL